MSMIELTLIEQMRREYSAEGMEEIFLRLDRLHDVATNGELDVMTSLSREELRGWLKEFIYTARETLREMGEE